MHVRWSLPLPRLPRIHQILSNGKMVTWVPARAITWRTKEWAPPVPHVHHSPRSFFQTIVEFNGFDCLGLDRTGQILYTWLGDFGFCLTVTDFRQGLGKWEEGVRRDQENVTKSPNDFLSVWPLTCNTCRTCGLAVVHAGALGLLVFHVDCTCLRAVFIGFRSLYAVKKLSYSEVYWVLLVRKCCRKLD